MSPEMMKRRLREGLEFFRFLRARREPAHWSVRGAASLQRRAAPSLRAPTRAPLSSLNVG